MGSPFDGLDQKKGRKPKADWSDFWVIGGGVVALVLVLAGGGVLLAVTVATTQRSSLVPAQAAPQPATGPKVVLGPKLLASGLKLGPMEWHRWGCETTLAVPASRAEGVRQDSLTVTLEGQDGLKLNPGVSDHPAASPGDKVLLKILGLDMHRATKVTLELR